MKTEIDSYVIEAVRRERQMQHVSQSMLAFAIGVSAGFIAQVENPNHRARYNLRHINEIAKFLGCSPRKFLPDAAL